MADDLSLPEVWEIGNRIPRMSDRHVNPADGSLCLGVPEELWVVWGQSFDLCKYLNGPVRDFLIGNTLIEQGEAWPHGECAHDVEGICAFYDEKFGTSEPIAIYQLLQYLSRERIKGHWGCPCGSGKKLRDCHFRIVLDLHQNLAAPAIRYSLGKLRCHMALEHRLNGTQKKGRPLQRDQSSP